jgi:hypothetical protein
MPLRTRQLRAAPLRAAPLPASPTSPIPPCTAQPMIIIGPLDHHWRIRSKTRVLARPLEHHWRPNEHHWRIRSKTRLPPPTLTRLQQRIAFSRRRRPALHARVGSFGTRAFCIQRSAFCIQTSACPLGLPGPSRVIPSQLPLHTRPSPSHPRPTWPSISRKPLKNQHSVASFGKTGSPTRQRGNAPPSRPSNPHGIL